MKNEEQEAMVKKKKGQERKEEKRKEEERFVGERCRGERELDGRRRKKTQKGD